MLTIEQLREYLERRRVDAERLVETETRAAYMSWPSDKSAYRVRLDASRMARRCATLYAEIIDIIDRGDLPT